MDARLLHWLHSFLPARPSVDATEGLRASTGALVGILATGLVGLLLLGSHPGVIWLIAPMGASAVLLFAVPSSPLAQPWSIIGGNLVASLIGVTAARWIDEPAVAAAAAIFFAIALMLLLRCLHPPSGAVTVMAVLGGNDLHAMGYAFVVSPVLLNSAVIVVAALVYNNLTGRHYPHNQVPEKTGDAARGGTRRIGFDDRDIEAALRQYNQVVDIGVEDLAALFRFVETTVFRRRYGDLQCRHVMHRRIPAVEFGTELAEAWETMRDAHLPALPVVDGFGYVIGIVTRGDFMRHADVVDERAVKARLAKFLQRTDGMYADKPEVVGQIMTSPVRTAPETTPVVELVPLFTDASVHHVPVVDANDRLVGMVEQADVIAALYDTIMKHDVPMPAQAAPA